MLSNLATLVKQSLEANTLSYREAERVTGLGFETIRRLATREDDKGGRRRAPNVDTIDKLVKLPGLTRSSIERAILADLGYIQTGTGDELTPVLDQVRALSDTDRKRLLAQVAAMVAEEGAS